MTTDEHGLAALLEERRARSSNATQGEWFYNSYACVGAADYVQREEDLELPPHCTEKRYGGCESCNHARTCPHWNAIYEADHAVAWVPAYAGDTALGRHRADADHIAFYDVPTTNLLIDLALAADAAGPWPKHEVNRDGYPVCIHCGIARKTREPWIVHADDCPGIAMRDRLIALHEYLSGGA